MYVAYIVNQPGYLANLKHFSRVNKKLVIAFALNVRNKTSRYVPKVNRQGCRDFRNVIRATLIESNFNKSDNKMLTKRILYSRFMTICSHSILYFPSVNGKHTIQLHCSESCDTHY